MSDDQHKIPKRLPANAKMVFKGVIFEVWQWEQELFDGTTAIFEKVWRVPTVEVIATVGDKILIEEQDQPDRKNNINLISGRADQSEDLLSEAKRELLEESGYASDDWTLFLKHEEKGKVVHDVHYYIARNARQIQEPHLDAGEKIRVKLISFQEFLDLVDEPRFWTGPEFIIYLQRIKADSDKTEEFRKLVFGK